MRGKRENFFSREKKFSLSPRAPLSLSRKAGNFFIYLYLPMSGTEPLFSEFSESIQILAVCTLVHQVVKFSVVKVGQTADPALFLG